MPHTGDVLAPGAGTRGTNEEETMEYLKGFLYLVLFLGIIFFALYLGLR